MAARMPKFPNGLEHLDPEYLSPGFKLSEDGRFAVLETPIEKSPNDKQDYRMIRLNNNLEAILVSGEGIDKAGVAMAVCVGTLNDPEDWPGLAHFAEHLSFMGSKKYPNANDYSKFMSENGGDYNAETGLDQTTYYFSIVPDALEGALDRFSQFFIAPTFDEASVTKEVKAVDHEFTMGLQSDGQRFEAVFKKVFCKSTHPYSRFGTGNLDSLWIKPLIGGRHPRDALLAWYDKTYSSNLMKLCVVGKEGLDALTDMVVTKFSEIPDRRIAPVVYEDDVLDLRLNKTIVFWETMQHDRILEMNFQLPDSSSYWRTCPSAFLGHLLGYEGEGSILSYLKDQGWTTGLCAGPSTSAIGFELFSISATLTESGLTAYKQVIEAIFAFIAKLEQEGCPKNSFDELATMSDIHFRFEERDEPDMEAYELAQQLQNYYPREQVMSGPYQSSMWDGDLIRSYLDRFKPDACVISVGCKAIPGGAEFAELEERYSTRYAKVLMDADLVQMMTAPKTFDELSLPKPNPFIPVKDVVAPVKAAESAAYPVLARSGPLGSLYYKRDSHFLVPRTYSWFTLVVPQELRTVENAVLRRLLTDILDENMSKASYDADVAGLHYAFCPDEQGFCLTLEGYTPGLQALLQRILEKMHKPDLDAIKFERVKSNLLDGLRNFSSCPPCAQASVYLAWLSDRTSYLPQQRLSFLEGLELQQMNSFLDVGLKKLFVEGFVEGDLTKGEGLEWSHVLERTIDFTPTPASDLAKPRSLVLEPGSSYLYRASNTNVKDANSAALSYYYFTTSDDDITRVQLLLLSDLLEEPFFDEIRTKKQLGYVVCSGVRTCAGAVGMNFEIQGNCRPEQLDAAIEIFLAEFKLKLDKYPEAEFEKHRCAIVANHLESFKNLEEEANFLQSCFDSGTFDYEHYKRYATLLESVTKDQVVDLFNMKLFPGSDQRAKLAVHVISQRLPYDLMKPILTGMTGSDVPFTFDDDFKALDVSEIDDGDSDAVAEADDSVAVEEPGDADRSEHVKESGDVEEVLIGDEVKDDDPRDLFDTIVEEEGPVPFDPEKAFAGGEESDDDEEDKDEPAKDGDGVYGTPEENGGGLVGFLKSGPTIEEIEAKYGDVFAASVRELIIAAEETDSIVITADVVDAFRATLKEAPAPAPIELSSQA